MQQQVIRKVTSSDRSQLKLKKEQADSRQISKTPTIKKSKTGKSKKSVLFRRTINEWKHGIVCKNCKEAKIRISFSAVKPLYCCKDCQVAFSDRKRKQKKIERSQEEHRLKSLDNFKRSMNKHRQNN